MALFSRKNIKDCKDQAIIDEFNKWLENIFNNVDECDRPALITFLTKNNYEFAKELYSITNNKEYEE